MLLLMLSSLALANLIHWSLNLLPALIQTTSKVGMYSTQCTFLCWKHTMQQSRNRSFISQLHAKRTSHISSTGLWQSLCAWVRVWAHIDESHLTCKLSVFVLVVILDLGRHSVSVFAVVVRSESAYAGRSLVFSKYITYGRHTFFIVFIRNLKFHFHRHPQFALAHISRSFFSPLQILWFLI